MGRWAKRYLAVLKFFGSSRQPPSRTALRWQVKQSPDSSDTGPRGPNPHQLPPFFTFELHAKASGSATYSATNFPSSICVSELPRFCTILQPDLANRWSVGHGGSLLSHVGRAGKSKQLTRSENLVWGLASQAETACDFFLQLNFFVRLESLFLRPESQGYLLIRSV